MAGMLDVAVRRLDGQTVVDLGRTPAPPVHPCRCIRPCDGLLPGGLRRGSTLSVSGSVSLLLALLGAGSAAGAWCALVGLPPISAEAAAEQGIDLARLAIVADRPTPACLGHRGRRAARCGRHRRRPSTPGAGPGRRAPAGRPGPQPRRGTDQLTATRLARHRGAAARDRG